MTNRNALRMKHIKDASSLNIGKQMLDSKLSKKTYSDFWKIKIFSDSKELFNKTLEIKYCPISIKQKSYLSAKFLEDMI